MWIFGLKGLNYVLLFSNNHREYDDVTLTLTGLLPSRSAN